MIFGNFGNFRKKRERFSKKQGENWNCILWRAKESLLQLFDATQKLGYPERDGDADAHTLTRKALMEMPRAKEHVAYRVTCNLIPCAWYMCLSFAVQSAFALRCSCIVSLPPSSNTQGRELTPNKNKNEASRRAQICTNRISNTEKSSKLSLLNATIWRVIFAEPV